MQSSPSPPEHPDTNPNVKIVLAIIAAFHAGDMEELLSHAHPDVEVRLPDELPFGGSHIGHEEFIRSHSEVQSAWDQLSVRVDSIRLAGHDHVVMEGAFVGRSNPSDADTTIPVAMFFTFRGALVARVAHYTDGEALSGH